ncbi:MAG TPA: hypothetical protein VF487_06085 [Chitinophagaceae bacterium]
MALIILILSAVLIFPILLELKMVSKSNKRITCAIILVFYVGLGYYFMYDSPRGKTGAITTVNSQSTTNSDMPSTNTTNTETITETLSRNNIQDVNNKKSSIEINAPITTNDNSQLTIANEINYNIPRQRHLTNKDSQDLKSIGSINDNIQILYPPNNNEALIYAEEIFNKLFDLGYKNVSKGTSDNLSKSSNKRFRIKQTKEESENIINIIINAQI